MPEQVLKKAAKTISMKIWNLEAAPNPKAYLEPGLIRGLMALSKLGYKL